MAGSGAVADRGAKQLAPAHTPPAIATSLHQHGMDSSTNLGPGRPLTPSFGYSTRPRATDYPTSVNISTKSRSQWGRVPFETLRAVIGAYDVSRMCVNHKIDELRSMELMFQPADRVDDDVEDAITAAKAALAYPDRELPYESWLSKWLEGAQKFDAAPLYKRRDFNGDIIALEVVDGTTVYPYIDENGRRPEAPAPAWNQIVHGMVAGWFTRQDLIYVPYRPQDDSPFGLAPIESILLTANTDLRFQWHFLQMFTDGSVPAGFMELPPDISNPDQVAEWQDYWDATVMGDQAKLHQLLAVPGGSKFTETKPKAFDPKFPEWLMKRTCAAYGVVPQDLGLVSDVNRANGETQVDIQFRVNTLPWVRYVEGILTRYLQHDIGLPVKVSLDTGRDKEDRLAEAQAHQLYVDMGAESPDEVRVDVLGKPVDKQRPTPRFYSTQRIGPVPLLAIEAVAGKTDPDTYGPDKSQKALDQPFVPPIGVIPHPGTTDDMQSQQAIDEAQVSERRQLDQQEGGKPGRETEADRNARAPKQADTQADTQAEAAAGRQVAKSLTGAEAAELSAFREFVTGSKRRGKWRDFVFKTVSPVVAAELNRGGRAEVGAVAKAKGTPGLTKRSGMISLDLPDGAITPVPGGVDNHHITVVYLGSDVDDAAFAEACSRAQQAAALMDGPLSGAVGGVDSFEPSAGSDGKTPAFAQVTLPGAQKLRTHLGDLSASEHKDYRPHVTLAYLDEGDPLPAPVPPTPVTFTHLSVHRGPEVVSFPLGSTPVAKADAGPKASARPAETWPGWQYDLAAAAYWAPRIGAALLAAVDVEQIAHAWLAGQHEQGDRQRKEARDALIVTAIGWLGAYRTRLAEALRPLVAELYTDGYAIGTAAATALVTRNPVDMGGWEPGEIRAAERLILDATDGAGLRALFEAAQVSIGLMADSRTVAMARALADAVLEDRTTSELGDALRMVLADPGRTGRLALAELTRASGGGANAVYQRHGVATHRWITAEDTKVCVICDDNAAQGPIPLGVPFESGDLWPPAHPGGCRCATIPG